MSFKLDYDKSTEKIKAIIESHYKSEFYENQQMWLKMYRGNNIQPQIKENMRTLNVVKMVSYEMASLILNENIRLNFSDDNIKMFFNENLNENIFIYSLQSKIEEMFALGGLGAEIISTEQGLEVNYIRADNVIPLYTTTTGEIEDIAFKISEGYIGDSYYTVIRSYEKQKDGYLMKNMLFKKSNSEDEGLGTIEPIESIYPDIVPAVLYPLNVKPFEYVRPNTANNILNTTVLGLPLTANSKSIIESIDLKYNSLFHEFLVGKKRMIIPELWIKEGGGPDSGYIDEEFIDSDFFISTNQDEDGAQIIEVDLNLRVDEHIQALNTDLELLSSQTGFSSGTFIYNGGSAVTATEVISQNSKTFKSKKAHEVLIGKFLQNLIRAYVSLGFILGYTEGYGITEQKIRDFEIVIDFDDSIVEDKQSELEYQIKLLNNGLTTKTRALMVIHNITEEEAEEIVRDIKSEDALLPEVTDMLGVEN